MTVTRRFLISAGLVALIAACARPVPFTPTGPGTEIRPLSLKAENISVDVSGLTDNEIVGKKLNFYKDRMAIDEPGGRPVRAVVNVHDFDFANMLASRLTGRYTRLAGEIAIDDLATGERLYVSDTIEVDARSVSYTEDSGVITRDAEETKAEKLSKLFIKRARQTLLATNE